MIIGVDIGTTNIKSGLIKNNQYHCIKYKYKTFCNSIQLTAEQDPADYLSGAIYCIGNLIKEFNICPEEVEAITFSGHSPSIICVDQNGNALGSSIIWQDKRAQAEAEILQSLLKTYINSSFNEAKMLWIYRNNNYLYNNTFKFLQPKDFVIMKLTGEFVIDRSAASTFPTYDQIKSSFIKLASANLDEEKMPRIVDPFEIAGTLKAEYCEALGLNKNVKIICGSVDAFCDALGCGIYDNDHIGESTGTSTCVFKCETQPDGYSPIHVLENKHIDILPMSYTGGCLEWFIKNIISMETNTDIFMKLENTLMDSEPGSKGLVFLPYIYGGRSPVWNDDAAGCFIGLTNRHDYKYMWRSVLEGIAFNLRQNFEIMDKQDNIKKVYAAGGGNQSSGWLQIKADICGKTFCRLRYSDGAIVGDIILGEYGIGIGDIKDIINKYIIVEKEYNPQDKYIERYDELYKIYRQSYEVLKSCLSDLAGLRREVL